ncbi:hypothetical protein GQX74_013120 [Glossina fuscipes]|nr:hypothetical protein GQX74_013120 [Glossina fuscipes]
MSDTKEFSDTDVEMIEQFKNCASDFESDSGSDIVVPVNWRLSVISDSSGIMLLTAENSQVKPDDIAKTFSETFRSVAIFFLNFSEIQNEDQLNLPRTHENYGILSFSAIENEITKLQQEGKINTFLKMIRKIAKN